MADVKYKVVEAALPSSGTAEVTDITCPADTMGDLTDTYFTFRNGADAAFYAWFNADGIGADPTPGGTGIEVGIMSDDTATAVATATASAIDANGNFSCTSSSAVATITNAAGGAATDAADGNAGVSVNVTTQGAAGTTDYTSAGFGTVKAAVIFHTSCITLGTRADGYEFGVGFWDGTNQGAAQVTAEDAVGTTATHRIGVQNRAALVGISGTLTEYTASAITDGIRLTLTVDNTAVQRRCVVLLIGGADAAGATGSFALHTAQNSATTKAHGMGVTPDAVLFTCSSKPNTNRGNDARLAFGVCSSDLTQRCVLWSSNNAVSAADVTARLETNSATGVVSSAGLGATGEITTLDATNIICTTRDAATKAYFVNYLALDLNGAGVDLRTLTSPTSTGDNAVSGVGFAPSALLQCLTKIATADSTIQTTDANSFQVGVTDGTNTFSLCSVDEDAAATTNTFSVTTSGKLIDLDNSASGSAADLITATTTLDGDGRTHNYTAVDGTARLGWELMFGVPASGLSIPIAAYHYNHSLRS